MDNVIKKPSATEKSMRMMEAENKLIFIVDLKANKSDIKKAFETMFKVKVVNVSTHITPQGEKKAYVKFGKDTPAIDIATQLGLM